MTLLKKAVQDQLKESPDINWDRVYDRILDDLPKMVNLDSLPDDMHEVPGECIDQAIAEAKGSQWIEDMLADARLAHAEYTERRRHPYLARGVRKSDFL